MTGSAILAAVACVQEKPRSAAPAARKKAGLWAMPIRSVGWRGPVKAVKPGRETVMRSMSCAREIAFSRGICGGLGERMVGMAAGHELDRHVGDDVPALPQIARRDGAARGAVLPAIDFEKSQAGFEDPLLGPVAALCRKRRLDAEHRRQPGMILARDAGVRRRHQPADRGGRERDRLRHTRGIELQQPPGGDRAAKDRGKAAMKPAGAEAGGDRFADAPGRLVAEDDRRQHILAAGAGPLGEGERGGHERRAGMDDIAQVAVVGGRGVAHHRIDPRRLGDRQFRRPRRTIATPRAPRPARARARG